MAKSEYFRMRAKVEHERAEAASDPRVREAHYTLSRQYEEAASRADAGETLNLHWVIER